MASTSVWNSLEVAKLSVSLATPLVVAFVGYWISIQLKAKERRSEETRELEQLEREARKEELERRHTPHIELELECQFLGGRNGHFLAMLTVVATNVGQVLHKFERITLRLRGIKDGPLEYRKGKEPQVEFPHKIFDTNLVQEGWQFIFVEPGVKQRLSLVTLIPADYTYVLAHVEFEYKKFWPHTAEAVFAVPDKTELGRKAV